MSAHTPGPWRYDRDNGEVRADDDRCCVATVEILDDSDANGLLIAAAPGMLAALEKVGCRAARVYASGNTCTERTAQGDVEVTPCHVCAAIAKARGT